VADKSLKLNLSIKEFVVDQSKAISGKSKAESERLSVKSIFVAAVVIGVIGIVTGVLLNSATSSVVIPLITMFGYIFVIYSSEPDLPKSTIGDSYYYLGFIFTLTSLAASLVALANNDGINMSSIIGSFGAALSTTIVGLVARLFETVFSVETKVRRERLEEEIERSMIEFSENLDRLTTFVHASLSNVHAETEKALKDTLVGYQKVNSDVTSSFESSMESGAETVSSAFEKLATKISNIDVNIEPFKNSFDQCVKDIDKQNKSYSDVTEQVISINENLTSQISKTNSNISDHIDKLESEISSVFKKNALHYEETLSEVSKSILSNFDDLKSVKAVIKGGAEKELEKLNSEVASLSNSMSSWNSSVSETLTNFTGFSDLVESNANTIELSSKRLEEVITTVDSSFSVLLESSGPIMDMKDAVEGFGEQLKSSIGVISEVNSSMQEISKSTENATKQVASDISDVYGSLAKQLSSLNSLNSIESTENG
jgi:hypothetical protein